jgi:hypothetical protein
MDTTPRAAPKRRRKPTVHYLSAAMVSAELGIKHESFQTWRKRYPDFPPPDAHIGPVAARDTRRASMDGWSRERLPEIVAWVAARPGQGAPGRPKTLKTRQAMRAAKRKRDELAAERKAAEPQS